MTKPLPCPFCGEPPDWRHVGTLASQGATGGLVQRHLACVNADCGIRPRTRGVFVPDGDAGAPHPEDGALLAEWNTRESRQQREREAIKSHIRLVMSRRA